MVSQGSRSRRQAGNADQGNHPAGVSFLSVDGADRLFREAIEQEGTFGEVAKNACESQQSWQQFGDREVPTTYNISIHLNDYERINARADEEAAALDELLPGLRQRIREERIAAFAEEDRKIWDTPADQCSQDQAQRAANWKDSWRRPDPKWPNVPTRKTALKRCDWPMPPPMTNGWLA